MRHFELPEERVEILREMLGSHLSELRMEIANTDDRKFREYLRERIDFLEEFLATLGRESVPEPVRISGPGVPQPLDSLLE